MKNKYNYSEKMYELFDINKNIITKHNDTDDLLKKYISDIRNIKKLDKEMISNISSMCNEDKMKVIIAYNDVVDSFSNFIEILNNE